jgi:hypothetical protein
MNKLTEEKRQFLSWWLQAVMAEVETMTADEFHDWLRSLGVEREPVTMN